MTAKPNQLPKMSRAIGVAQAAVVLLLMFCVPTILAEIEEAETADSVAGLDLFDEDVEETRKGWPQLHVSAGIMYLDADGRFSARLPDGNDLPIIDFDRIGLDESDSSYWLSLYSSRATPRTTPSKTLSVITRQCD